MKRICLFCGSNQGLLLVDSDPSRLLRRMGEFPPPPTHKWIDRDQT